MRRLGFGPRSYDGTWTTWVRMGPWRTVVPVPDGVSRTALERLLTDLGLIGSAADLDRLL
jgi:hypothetical protein